MKITRFYYRNAMNDKKVCITTDPVDIDDVDAFAKSLKETRQHAEYYFKNIEHDAMVVVKFITYSDNNEAHS